MSLSILRRSLPILAVASLVAWCAPQAWGQPEHKTQTAAHGDAHASAEHGAAGHAAHKADPMEHVGDSKEIHLLGGRHPRLPFGMSKFMLIELIAAALVLAIYIPLARRLATGEPARGAWANAFEGMLTFIREDVAKPNLGEHEADRYLPFLWTLFLFILFSNLLGMIPFLGSPTASIWVTGALAVCAFFAIHGSAVAKMGLGHYLKSLWPNLDIPIPGVGFVINLMICGIEIFGAIVKSSVLSVRLFANMFAGHMVLATILGFIIVAAGTPPVVSALWGTVTVGSVLGVVALSLLELFVAFLQAYIFVFLTALFMGMSLHPHH